MKASKPPLCVQNNATIQEQNVIQCPSSNGEDTFGGSFLPYLSWKRQICAFTNMKNQLNGPRLCPVEGSFGQNLSALSAVCWRGLEYFRHKE